MLDAYKSAVLWIKHATRWGDAAIHLHVGLLLFCATIVVARRSVRSGVPLAVVVLAEAGNETIDYIMQTSWSATDTIGDIFHTLLWPVIFTLYAIVTQRVGPTRR